MATSVFFAPKSSHPRYDPSTENEADDCVCVLSVGMPFLYVIPSFVLRIEMRQMRIKGYTVTEKEEHNYDIFIRNDPLLCRSYLLCMVIKDATIIEVSLFAFMTLCIPVVPEREFIELKEVYNLWRSCIRHFRSASHCITEFFYFFFAIQQEEFSIYVKTSGLRLPPQGVLVVWEWSWQDENSDVDHVSESSFESTESDHHNPYIQTDTESEGEQETEFCLPSQTHTVTFKCIGTTHDFNAQETLRKVSKLLGQEEQVPLVIVPEPDNQYDSKAIAFKCKIDGEWRRIGYIVREALDHVHTALTQKKILNVNFAWVKYLVIWMRSGPGYYAGVNISINGEWPAEVCRCASTR